MTPAMSKVSRDVLKSSVDNILKQSKEKPRNFIESVELIFKIKDYDPKKEKPFIGMALLPNNVRPQINAFIFGDQHHCDLAKKLGIDHAGLEEFKKLNTGNHQDEIKKLIKKYHFFFISKDLIRFMKPKFFKSFNKKEKFPITIEHSDNIANKVQECCKTISFRYSRSCVLGTRICDVQTEESKIIENATYAIDYFVSLLKKKWLNVDSINIKSAMGKPTKIY